MKIKNNSKKEWLQYNCGENVIVDILPLSVIEVSDKAGELLLRNLGCPNWLTEVSDEVVDEVLKKANEIVQPDKLADEITDEVKKPYLSGKDCKQCDSKGVIHKKVCPTNSKDNLDPVGEQEEANSL